MRSVLYNDLSIILHLRVLWPTGLFILKTVLRQPLIHENEAFWICGSYDLKSSQMTYRYELLTRADRGTGWYLGSGDSMPYNVWSLNSIPTRLSNANKPEPGGLRLMSMPEPATDSLQNYECEVFLWFHEVLHKRKSEQMLSPQRIGVTAGHNSDEVRLWSFRLPVPSGRCPCGGPADRAVPLNWWHQNYKAHLHLWEADGYVDHRLINRYICCMASCIVSIDIHVSVCMVISEGLNPLILFRHSHVISGGPSPHHGVVEAFIDALCRNKFVSWVR